MQSDFLDAHNRHWYDAEQLYLQTRLANADHLYGMAAECGLKKLMLAFGMNVDVNGTPTERINKFHANGAWRIYNSFNFGAIAARYPLPQTDPFHNWNASQRYAHQSNFTVQLVSSHQSGANVVRNIIKQAQLDGLI